MARKSRKNVGLIGLGIIGSRVAAALRHGGFHVYVWNRTPCAAPNFLRSPAEVAELCDVIQIFVSDAHALFEVIDAMGEKLTDQHVIVCNATVGPEATIEAAKAVEEYGAKFIDAPFTGSKPAAENRELVYYVGGDEEVFKRVEPMLKASSKEIVKIGKIGQAATVKVATNMLSAVMVQTLAEAMAIVEKSGIAPDLMVEALEYHGVRSGVLDMKLGKMVHHDYEPQFSMKHMFKDVQLAIHIANSLEIDIPATTATAGVMYGGLSRGWADLDFSALAKIYETEKEAASEPVKELPAPPAHASHPPDAAPPKETLGSIAPPPRERSTPEPEKTGEKKPAETPKPAEAPSTPPASEKNESDPKKTTDEKPADAAKKNDEPAKSNEAVPPFNRIRRWFGAGAA